jgi:Domain of unknown function (DUF6398)
MSLAGEALLVELKVPRAMRPRVAEMLAITDGVCAASLDREYTELARELVARLARKRPSPLARGAVRIWAAGALHALGQINFLFDRSQQPHMTADQLAGELGVVKATMANKAATIRRTLDLGYCEPGLTRQSLYENPPLALLVLALPAAFRAAERRGGLIADLQARRVA